MVNPPLTSDPLKDINDRIETYRGGQDYFLSTIRMVKKDEKRMLEDEHHLKAEAEERTRTMNHARARSGVAPATTRPSLALVSAPSRRGPLTPPATSRTDPDTDDIYPEEIAFGGVGNLNPAPRGPLANPMHTSTPSRRNTGLALMDRIHKPVAQEEPVLIEPEPIQKGIPYDDGLGTLTADEYVKMRLIPIVSEFTVKAPEYSRSVTIVTSIVILLSITSSIFASFSLTVFIPLALAFGEALTSWQSHNATEIRLMQTNGAMHDLHKVNHHSN